MQRSPTEDSPGYLIKRVQQALRKRCDATLRPTGLTMAQYAVLRALADHPDASAAELARRCFVTRQSLQDVLGGLRSAGFIEGADTPTRGRARALALTQAGRHRLDGADGAVKGVESVMLQGIPRSLRSQLADALIRCAQNLEAGQGDTESTT